MSFREGLPQGCRDDTGRSITTAWRVVQIQPSRAREEEAQRPWVSVIGIPFANAVAKRRANVRTKEPYASDWVDGMPLRRSSRQGETRAGLPRSAPLDSDSPALLARLIVHICIFILSHFAWQNGVPKTATDRFSRSWSRPRIATRIQRGCSHCAYLYLYTIPFRMAKRRPKDWNRPFLNELEPARNRDANKAAWCTLCIFVSLYYPASRRKAAPRRLQRIVAQRVGTGQKSQRE